MLFCVVQSCIKSVFGLLFARLFVQDLKAVTCLSTTCRRSLGMPSSCRCFCPLATSSLPKSSWTEPPIKASVSVSTHSAHKKIKKEKKRKSNKKMTTSREEIKVLSFGTILLEIVSCPTSLAVISFFFFLPLFISHVSANQFAINAGKVASHLSEQFPWMLLISEGLWDIKAQKKQVLQDISSDTH